MKRKLISSLLCLCMLVSLIPVAAFATGTADKEAAVVVGTGAEKKTALTNGVHTYTAPANSTLSIVKSGNDITQVNNNKYNYYPKITMPDVASADEATTYYILSRGANKDGLNATALDTLMSEATAGITSSGKAYYDKGTASFETWFQVYTAAGFKADNVPYWPGIGGDPVVNIVVATQKTDATTKAVSYEYEKYQFDFSTVTIARPFDISSPTDATFKETTGKAANDLQSNIGVKETTVSVGSKTFTITGTSHYVTFPWFASGSEGNYVALKFAAPSGGTAINKIVVTLSDKSTKTLDPDNTLIWQITDENKNYPVPIRVYYGSADTEGSVVYYLDMSKVTCEAKAAAGTLSVTPTAETNVLTKDVTTIQSGIEAKAGTTDATKNTITVTGESKYVYNWTQFSSDVAQGQQSGHYVALDLSTSEGGTISYQSPTEQNKTKTITTRGTLVLRLENFDTTALKNQLKVTVKANAQDAGTEYTIDFSQITKQSATGLTVAPAATEKVLNKNVSELQSISVGAMGADKTFAVTGLSQYVTGWTQFSNTPAMQSGHFVALDLSNAFSKTANSGVTITVTGPTGSTPPTKTLDDGILVVRLENFAAEADGYKVKVAVTAAGKTENYVIDLSNVVLGDEHAKVITTAGTTAGSVSDELEIKNDNGGTVTLTDPQAAAVNTKLTSTANSIEVDANDLIAANAEDLNTVAKSYVTATVTNVEVTVYPKVEATGVEVAIEGGNAVIKSMTYDIDLVYKVENKTSGTVLIAKDQPLKNKQIETEVSVDLTGFAAKNEANIYAVHNGNEWNSVTVTEDAQDPSKTIGTFTTSGFSPFKFVKDTRTMNVTFVPGTGATMTGTTTRSYTVANIGDPLPTASKTGATFDGWQFNGETYKTLTSELFEALYAATTKTLTAAFSTGGGGGGVSSNVTIDRPTNGKVSVTPTAPSKGATVTINLTPDTGYAVGTVTVTDKDGKAVELTKVSDTKYTFTMPDGKVTVKATFTKVDTPPATGFTDVPADAYYADAVKWAVDKGITNGLTATTFGPNNSCTRAQMVTFLWRGAGSPAPTGTNSFTDVASGEYYYNAVLWAVEKGITKGTTDTTFSPNATVNRAQTVTFLYRYAGSPAATGDNAFTDVAAGQYYTDAVKWAVAEEITNGTSATTFAPNNNCTRGQIVTFLYRQMAE